MGFTSSTSILLEVFPLGFFIILTDLETRLNFGFYLLTFNYMQLKIVVLSGGSKKWCFDRLESDMMIFVNG